MLMSYITWTSSPTTHNNVTIVQDTIVIRWAESSKTTSTSSLWKRECSWQMQWRSTPRAIMLLPPQLIQDTWETIKCMLTYRLTSGTIPYIAVLCLHSKCPDRNFIYASQPGTKHAREQPAMTGRWYEHLHSFIKFIHSLDHVVQACSQRNLDKMHTTKNPWWNIPNRVPTTCWFPFQTAARPLENHAQVGEAVLLL